MCKQSNDPEALKLELERAAAKQTPEEKQKAQEVYDALVSNQQTR